MKTKLDFLGMPIRPPCVIVYPVRKGSSMYLRKISVERVLEDRIVGFDENSRRVSVRNLDNVVVVDAKVNSREDEWLD